jgi:hypothetical protein
MIKVKKPPPSLIKMGQKVTRSDPKSFSFLERKRAQATIQAAVEQNLGFGLVVLSD